ncbi:MAG: tyrosine-type recombinase/integrase [Dehalococcoidia bacterium]
MYSPRDRKTIRKTFRSLAEARAWRSHAQEAIRRGALRAPSRETVAEASERWLEAARAGVVRTRSGETYKPGVLRGYSQNLRARIVPELGNLRVSEVTRNDVQDIVDRMLAEGLGPSTVKNAILPLRSIYRRLVSRSEVAENPTLGLDLPANRARRERIARPAEAGCLLAALGDEDRAVFATALYAGLRRGEIKGLRWCDVDFEEGLIRVERGWDDVAGPIAPKSRSGRRRVPLSRPLRVLLAEHRLRRGSPAGEELVFGRGGGKPLEAEWATKRARKAWKAAGLAPIGLHECRHTYASFMIAAGINAKALSTYMGHSSISITLDRYGHLLPGNEGQAAEMLADYLDREVGSAWGDPTLLAGSSGD